jgi:hypothetical protein
MARANRTGTDRPISAAEARAEVEADRAQRSRARRAAFEQRYGDTVHGRAILALSWVCTAVFAAVSIGALIDDDLVPVAALVSIALFLAGCALFAAVLVLAALRSRDDLMGIGGLFFLAGSAPPVVQWNLLGSLGVQVVVAVLAASVRPFTEMAFGTLVPTIALALCGLWSVRHGIFAARDA